MRSIRSIFFSEAQTLLVYGTLRTRYKKNIYKYIVASIYNLVYKTKLNTACLAKVIQSFLHSRILVYKFGGKIKHIFTRTFFVLRKYSCQNNPIIFQFLRNRWFIFENNPKHFLHMFQPSKKFILKSLSRGLVGQIRAATEFAFGFDIFSKICIYLKNGLYLDLYI